MKNTQTYTINHTMTIQATVTQAYKEYNREHFRLSTETGDRIASCRYEEDRRYILQASCKGLVVTVDVMDDPMCLAGLGRPQAHLLITCVHR